MKNGNDIDKIKKRQMKYKNGDKRSKYKDIFLWNCGLIYYLDDMIMNNTKSYYEFVDYYNHSKHFQEGI